MITLERRLERAQTRTRDWALGKDVHFRRVPLIERSDSKNIRVTKRSIMIVTDISIIRVKSGG
jgi:hypothetical protein